MSCSLRLVCIFIKIFSLLGLYISPDYPESPGHPDYEYWRSLLQLLIRNQVENPVDLLCFTDPGA